jgi:hypothetical protein
MYNGGSGWLHANNADADGHAAMHDETRPCVTWENWNAINIA